MASCSVRTGHRRAAAPGGTHALDAARVPEPRVFEVRSAPPMSDATVTDALRSLAPTAETAEQAYLAIFRDTAELLLNRTTLYVARRPHRFTELELYWSGLQHLDPFT